MNKINKNLNILYGSRTNRREIIRFKQTFYNIINNYYTRSKKVNKSRRSIIIKIRSRKLHNIISHRKKCRQILRDRRYRGKIPSEKCGQKNSKWSYRKQWRKNCGNCLIKHQVRSKSSKLIRWVTKNFRCLELSSRRILFASFQVSYLLSRKPDRKQFIWTQPPYTRC